MNEIAETAESRALLLDTHVWLWLALGDSRLGKSAREAIESGLRAENVSVAAISLWEVAMLSARGRVQHAEPLASWLEKLIAVSCVNVVPLTPAIAVESVSLPEPFQRDPADRLIVASARTQDAALVTADRRMLDYGKLGHLKVVSAQTGQ